MAETTFEPTEQTSRRKPLLVVLTGAGMSAESGIQTFRAAGGLWENHPISKVASPAGWASNPALVLDFYNQRRRKMRRCEPNDGHHGLVRLEEQFDVRIITQNVDNLHERAGSTNIIHLHGELSKARGTLPPHTVVELGERDIALGDTCPHGSQLRPHIVWFGESVMFFEEACAVAAEADFFVIIGTSLVVYPAAELVNYAPPTCPVWLIDPDENIVSENDARFANRFFRHIKRGASEGVRLLEHELTERMRAASGGGE